MLWLWQAAEALPAGGPAAAEAWRGGREWLFAQKLPRICPKLSKNAQDERQAGMLGAQEQCDAGRPATLAQAAAVRCAACLAWQARGTAWMPMRNQACPLERTWWRERAQKRSVAGAACGTGVNLGLLREGRTCMDKKDLHG